MYSIGDKFYFDEDYKNKVVFCNNSNYKIAVVGKDEKGSIYQIQDKPELSDEDFLLQLRERREIECFSIINRGQLWYNLLNAEQYAELNDWYKKWLDVTETKVIPVRPGWLK